MTADDVIRAAMAIVPIVVAITLHEAAHGYAALALGDDTASKQGRLSLNPLKHIDPVGTVIVPGVLLVSQLLVNHFQGTHHTPFMFGWAKPVPVAAWKFANPRRGMAFVAVAGPAMNFFLAWLTALSGAVTQADLWSPVASVALYFMLTNLVLGLFNLLPIPPLDGGRIAVGILPEALARSWAKLERYGIFIVLGAILVLPKVFGIDPISDGLGIVLPWSLRIVFWLAGRDV